ncbi:hypothetical protein CA13_38020 [Planctomycetes bacterium CA13]|uniref:Uncharacterized protein n=1 Tax=Novipirellula herctigrandis TaxID=2527986 RepID=A0A5C5Z566_9BACT|nr:hypothetical protein CA13_38020 [Planctomycetes bacterium CA13]
MAKSTKGDDFVMTSSKPPARRGVAQSPRGLTGASSGCNFLFSFSIEAQLADFTSRRAQTTALKLMNAVAVAYTLQMLTPRMVVGGAHLKGVTGKSTRVTINGKAICL